MKPFWIRWAVTSAAVMVADAFVGGVQSDSLLALLAFSLFLGIVNALVRPVLLLLSVPFILVTMGFFILILNAFLFWMVGGLVPGFATEGFWSAFFGAFWVSVVSWILNAVFRTSDGHYHAVTFHPAQENPQVKKPEEKQVEGRVIDG